LPPGRTLSTVKEENDCLVEDIKQERGCLGGIKARLFMSPGVPELMGKVDALDQKIKAMINPDKPNPTSTVIVTFETEAAQRRVLAALTVGKLKKTGYHMFRGEHVLQVEEPEEPSTIRWQQHSTSELVLWRQVTVSMFTSLLAILIAVVLIQIAYSTFAPAGSYATAIATAVYPTLAAIFTKRESHASETELQKWLYIKIALFNVATTAMFLPISTPFTATLDGARGSVPGIITNVHRLFYSQLLVSPLLQLADLGGHFKRHVLAPRAKTQAAMNNLMKGAGVDLSIRYANMTKFVVLMVWYCAIYPPAFFMASFALFIAYLLDKFCLLRAWGHVPRVGTQLAHFTRDYVFPLCFVIMAVVSAYTWSGFPYDNLCKDPEPLNEVYVGDWELMVLGQDTTILGFELYSIPNITEEFTIPANSEAYRFCNQDLRVNQEKSFPALPSFQKKGFEWMTDDQELVTLVYGWTTVAVVALVLLTIVWRFVEWAASLVFGFYQPRGRDMKLNYSDVYTIEAYIPQVQSPLYEYVNCLV
jgi:hypothetical protein